MRQFSAGTFLGYMTNAVGFGGSCRGLGVSEVRSLEIASTRRVQSICCFRVRRGPSLVEMLENIVPCTGEIPQSGPTPDAR